MRILRPMSAITAVSMGAALLVGAAATSASAASDPVAACLAAAPGSASLAAVRSVVRAAEGRLAAQRPAWLTLRDRTDVSTAGSDSSPPPPPTASSTPNRIRATTGLVIRDRQRLDGVITISGASPQAELTGSPRVIALPRAAYEAIRVGDPAAALMGPRPPRWAVDRGPRRQRPDTVENVSGLLGLMSSAVTFPGATAGCLPGAGAAVVRLRVHAVERRSAPSALTAARLALADAPFAGPAVTAGVTARLMARGTRDGSSGRTSGARRAITATTTVAMLIDLDRSWRPVRSALALSLVIGGGDGLSIDLASRGTTTLSYATAVLPPLPRLSPATSVGRYRAAQQGASIRQLVESAAVSAAGSANQRAAAAGRPTRVRDLADELDFFGSVTINGVTIRVVYGRDRVTFVFGPDPLSGKRIELPIVIRGGRAVVSFFRVAR